MLYTIGMKRFLSLIILPAIAYWAFVIVNAQALAPVISNVRAVNISSVSAQILWTTDVPADSTVEYGTVSGIYSNSMAVDCSGQTAVRDHCLNIVGLSPNVQYFYRVRSINAQNVETVSPEYSFYAYPSGDNTIQVPINPTNLRASATGSQVTLVWNDNSNNETWFRIYKRSSTANAWALLESGPSDVNSYTQTNVSTGTHYYQVAACTSSNCSGGSNPISITVTGGSSVSDTSPPTPPNVTITLTSSTRIDLNWLASSDNIGVNGYKIYRGINSASSLPLLTSLSKNTLTYTDTDLKTGTTYYYQVEAVDAAGNRSFPNQTVSATTAGLSAYGVEVVSPESGQCLFPNTVAQIRWIQGPAIDHVAVYYSPYGYNTRPAYPNYIYLSAKGENSYNWTVPNLATIEGVIWIIPYDSAGKEWEGDINNEYFQVSNCPVASIPPTVTPTPEIPAVPSEVLTAVLTSSTNVQITWRDNSINESEFKVYRRIKGGVWRFINSVPAGTTSYVDINVPGGTYDYDLSACSSGGCSGYSSYSTITLANQAVRPSVEDYGLKDGDTISAIGTDDPDIYIVNGYGYKRLFLNPVIFEFYGHLGGFNNVKKVVSAVRDNFTTSGFFRNCETNDAKVYGVEITGEDTGTLHWINMDGAKAVAEDANFFKKVFCINNNEFNWYKKSSANYTSLSQVPVYLR